MEPVYTIPAVAASVAVVTAILITVQLAYPKIIQTDKKSDHAVQIVKIWWLLALQEAASRELD